MLRKSAKNTKPTSLESKPTGLESKPSALVPKPTSLESKPTGLITNTDYPEKMGTEITIVKVKDASQAMTNCIFFNFQKNGVIMNPKNGPISGARQYIEIAGKYYGVINDQTLEAGEFAINKIHRREIEKSQLQFAPIILTEDEVDEIHKPISHITVEIKDILNFNGADTLKPEISREELTAQVERQIKAIKYFSNNQSNLITVDIGCDSFSCQIQTSSYLYKNYKMYPSLGSRNARDTVIEIVNRTKNLIIREQDIFKFEDIQKMGVGGLGTEFEELFRRAFSTRTLDSDVIRALGIKHVKGIMLYGPPGCGKTLIARKISEMIRSVEPVIVNGPELMSQYVGKTEENIRKVFEPAEKDYRSHGDGAKLHVIIFDEIDSICKQRGTETGGTGVGDRIVNQLLTIMDGVNQINNIVVIGLTNRLDLIDEALLRPGRFEVKLEIGLPDRQGRFEILTIHTAKLKNNGCLNSDVSIDEIADSTENYTGAELEGLVNSARSYALCRSIDLQKAKKQTGDSKNKTADIKVTHSDFTLAMREVKPAFGKTELISDLEAGVSNFGVHMFDDALESAYVQTLEKLELFKRSKQITSIVTIEGGSGTGKTTLALDIAKKAGYPLIKFINHAKTVGLSDYQKSSFLKNELLKVKNSSGAVIVIDDLERIVDLSLRSEIVMNSLLILLDDLQKTGVGCKYLIVLTGSPGAIRLFSNGVDQRSIIQNIVLPQIMISSSKLKALNTALCSYAQINSSVKVKHISIYLKIFLNCDRMPIKYYIQRFSDELLKYTNDTTDNIDNADSPDDHDA